MLDAGFVSSALYSNKELKHVISCYKKKIDIITSFENNILGTPAEPIYEKICTLLQKIDRLKILRNVIMVALGKLSDVQRDVVRLFYFKKQHCIRVIEKLKISENQFKYNKKTALEKIAFYMYMLGFTNERFLEYFNDEPLIVITPEQSREVVRIMLAIRESMDTGRVIDL